MGLRVFNITVKNILNGVSFELEKGDKLAILGKNGSGKSTLLKSIAREIEALGEVFYKDINLFLLNKKEFYKKISYLQQHTSRKEIRVFDLLLLARKPFFRFSPSKKDLERVERVIKDFALSNIAFKSVSLLSGGEFQKVMIAFSFVQESEIILMDEPTNHLDIKNQRDILKMINNSQKTAILVMHDINLALRYCNKFLFLKDGKVEKFGDSSIIEEDLIKKVYDIEVEICKFNDKKVVVFSE